MKISFVSVISAGSDPTAPIGAITAVIGGETFGWLVVALDEFKEVCEQYAATSPLMTQERIASIKKKWQRADLGEAVKELAALHKSKGVDTVIWDDDVVSRISAFAYLWCQVPDRPALRRCEGERYDYQATSLLSLAGPNERLNMFNISDRWAKCSKALKGVLARLEGDAAEPAPLTLPPMPKPQGITLPPPALKLPGQ